MILAIDMSLSILATYISLYSVFYLLEYDISKRGILLTLALSVICSLFAFFVLKTYRRIIRHTNFKDIGNLGIVSVIKICLMGAVYFFFRNQYVTQFNPLLAEALIDVLLTFILLVGVRLVMIILYDNLLDDLNRKGDSVLVYGIGQKSVSLITLLNQSNEYNLVGFVAYNMDSSSFSISDYKVYGFTSELDCEHIISRSKCKYILFPTTSDLSKEKDRLVKYCQKNNVKMLVSPNIDRVGNSDGIPKLSLREIRIEDLLGRDEIMIDMEEVSKTFSGKTVMVTGAAGSIGSELSRLLAEVGISKLILFDSAETPLHDLRLYMDEKYDNTVSIIPIIGDVRNKKRLDAVFSKYRPNVVFHAAAYKHVPLMEDNPCEAVFVNIIGTRNVADICVKYGTENMIMISTDKAVNPTNVMGATKRAAEMYVQSLGIELKEGRIKGKTKFVTTRFGNVLGSNGSVIPRFRQQIEMGGPVTVTSPDINRFFMSIPEASRLVLEAATMGEGCDIFVFDMGEPVKIVDLARKMIELAGYKPDEDIKIIFTGLRPGEKLYEEVLSDQEKTLPTKNKKIRIAKVKFCEYDWTCAEVDLLEKYSREGDVIKSVSELKKMVTEYLSQNSVFEELDTNRQIRN